MKHYHFVSLSLGLWLLAGSLSAATLVNWDFSEVPATTAPDDNQPIVNPLLTADKSNAIAGVTSSDLTGSSGLVYSVGNPAPGELNVKSFDTNPIGSNDNYLAFTLTGSDSSTTIDIVSLSLGGWRNGDGAPNNLAFSYSVDGGEFLPFGESVTVPFAGVGTAEIHTFTQAISGANSVEFRFVPFAAAPNTAGTGNLHIDLLRVEGSVNAIPEPSVALLGILGGLAALRRRRA